MNKDARQTFIMEQLHQNKHIKIKTLSQQLNVSMETIRRDLTELEVHYRLDRMHGR